MERLEELSARLAGTWTFEVAALLTTATSLAALIGLLIATDGEKIMTWQGITLNTLVSILSTVSRLSALYVFSATIGQAKWTTFSRRPGSLLEFEAIDMASRGPVGCLLLLLRTRKIALIGALAVLTALAFDPFAQQLVQLRSDVIYGENVNASMPVAQTYDAGSLSYISAVAANDYGLNFVNVEAALSIQSSVLGGLVQSNSLIEGQLPLQCGSGNCTWDAVPSLAVCSVCYNVTQALQISPPTGEDYPVIFSLSNENLGAITTNATAYSLADKVFINNVDGVDTSSRKRLTMTAYGSSNSSSTTSLQDRDTLIWAMGMIRARPPTSNASWPNEFSVEATECGLYYCVKEYSVNITNNKATTVSREVTSAKRDPSSWQWLDDAGEGLSDSMKQALYFPDPNDPAAATLTGLTANDRTDLVLRNDSNTFNISQTAVLSLSYYMNKTFTLERTQPFNASDPNKAAMIGGFYISHLPLATDTDRKFSNQSEPSVMQALHESDDMGETFAAVAASMSNAIRTHSSGSTNSVGELGELVTTYSISWFWILLPALVVIAALMQLCSTIISSRDSPKWKTSTLATLSRGHFVGELFHDSRNLNDFRVAAGEKDVYLFDNVGGSFGRDDAKRGSEAMELQEQGAKFQVATAVRETDDSHDYLLRASR